MLLILNLPHYTMRILLFLPLLFVLACTPKEMAGDAETKDKTMAALQIPSGWDLVSCEIDGKMVPAANDKAFVAIRAGQIGGHTGCNAFGGDWSGDPDKMKVPGVMATKMFCADCAEQERVILNVMNGTVKTAVSGKELTLTGKAGTLKLRRNDARLK